MAQLLQSTRNYLKTSTRLGRRMSQYDDEELNSHNINKNGGDPPIRKSTDSTSTRSINRLSGLFRIDRKPSMQDQPQPHGEMKHDASVDASVPRRNSKSSGRTHRSLRHRSQEGSAHMENEVPRGRSPALSVSNSVSTAASSYDTRPSDYPSMRQYQSHVWRRNLLEESIMHSLRLGYAERNRSSSRHRSRSKLNSASRKAREQAMLNAAMGQELPPLPVGATLNLQTSQEDVHGKREPSPSTATAATTTTTTTTTIVSRQIPTTPIPTGYITPQPQTPPQTPKSTPKKNSPYQAHDNASMANITHSFASFSFELPETQVSHIMASSAVPNMFKVRPSEPELEPELEPKPIKPRGRRDSRTRILSIGGPSPRVLTGKSARTEQGEMSGSDLESPVSPTSAWVNSVFSTLEPSKEKNPLQVAAPAV
ncbi:hypothetical protein BGZ93_011180 [Podila epicladia]|nr:hypothetical protein BGZ92_005701 [Podila epicladia]KAG0087054.1 hypothetical protein BGZ93_011180 [Podila epicladia]